MSAAGMREVSIARVLSAILRHYRLLLAFALIPAFFVGLLGVTSARSYTSVASFMPQAGPGGSPAGGASSLLAAQLGVGVGTAATQSQFYADLLRSHEVLRELVNTPIEFRDADGKLHRSLIDAYGLSGLDSLYAVERAIQQVKASISAKPQATGVVDVKVTAAEPHLAAVLAGRLIDLLNDFNLRRRQSQAGAERRFVASRLEDARGELAAEEAKVDEFLLHNRMLAQSARLQFEKDRMLQRLKMREDVVSTLMQTYEQARIDEVRNTPVITVVEPPIVPIIPDPRGVTQRVFATLIGGFIIGLILVFLLEVRRSMSSASNPDYRELSAVFDDLRWDLRHPVRGILGRRRGMSSSPRVDTQPQAGS